MACENFIPRMVSTHTVDRTPMMVCQSCGGLPSQHNTVHQSYGGFAVGDHVRVHKYHTKECVGSAIIEKFLLKNDIMFVEFDRTINFGDVCSRDAHISCISKFTQDEEPEAEITGVSSLAISVKSNLDPLVDVSITDIQEILDVVSEILTGGIDISLS